jgi:2-hydroxychromene-2-carboxylate isomerase
MRMAEIVDFAARRAERLQRDAERLGLHSSAAAHPVEFVFDPISPFSYLALERVERQFPRARWRVADGRRFPPLVPAARERAERRAQALRIPLVWPESRGDGILARRVAAYATQAGRGPEFALALGRLTFCGGYDPDDLDLLVEAGAAAHLSLTQVLTATTDVWLDDAAEAAAAEALAAGVTELPAMCVRGRVFGGEERLAEAAAVAKHAL